MTDTTDIKALRERLFKWREGDLKNGLDVGEVDEIADCAIDQLEAERQRLELVREQRDNELKTNSQLEAELAALRGTQEPIGYLFDSHLKQLKNGKVVSLWPVAAFGETVEVFTHQPKPVVVLPIDRPQPIEGSSHRRSYTMGWNARGREDRKAIEAAGIVVKDGE